MANCRVCVISLQQTAEAGRAVVENQEQEKVRHRNQSCLPRFQHCLKDGSLGGGLLLIQGYRVAENESAFIVNYLSAQSPQQPQQDAVPPGCSVYVGNLQWGVRSEELTNFMSRVGEVGLLLFKETNFSQMSEGRKKVSVCLLVFFIALFFHSGGPRRCI